MGRGKKQKAVKAKASEEEKRARAIKEGYRSGLEEAVAHDLDKRGVKYTYETVKVKYIIPESKHTYTPDFILDNGIIVETKGRFVTADRKKHLLIKSQHPELDIRFVFAYPNSKLDKDSKTTYAGWCQKHGFLFAKGSIPEAWVKERCLLEDEEEPEQVNPKRDDTKSSTNRK